MSGNKVKLCFVCGCASNVFFDLAQAFKLVKELNVKPMIVAINNVALYMPLNVNVWASLHPELFIDIASVKGNPITVAPYQTEKSLVDYIFKSRHALNSGFYATDYAINNGFDRIILCGVPKDGQRRFDEPLDVPNHQGDADNIRYPWIVAVEENYIGWRDKVRSMSGNTKVICGFPEKEWLYGKQD